MTAQHRSAQPRALAAVVIVALLVVAVVAYAGAGWQRMDSACSMDAAAPDGASIASASFGWSWLPPGFACTWEGGDGTPVTVVKLWW